MSKLINALTYYQKDQNLSSVINYSFKGDYIIHTYKPSKGRSFMEHDEIDYEEEAIHEYFALDCFNPGQALQELISQKPKTILVTTGALEHLENSLGIDFPTKYVQAIH